TLDSSPLQLASIVRDKHRVRIALLDLDRIWVFCCTFASNRDEITALDSNACIGNVLDVLLDSGVLLTTNNDRTAVHDGLEALNDRGRNADNKLLLILVDICIGTVRIVNNFRDSLVGLNNIFKSDDMCITGLVYVCKLCTIVINVTPDISIAQNFNQLV